MIVVFVIDTSPSMREPLVDAASSTGNDKTSSLSRLDIAKMTVESLVKMLERRVMDHNLKVQSDTWPLKSLQNLGFGYSSNDQFLLLSTGCQSGTSSSTSMAGAGGRLLVGFGPHAEDNKNDTANAANNVQMHMHSQKIEFERELKTLKGTEWNKNELSFPEDGGGASGLNTALSLGLQLLSRNRLKNRCTENFGLGRLPSNAILAPATSGPSGGMQQAANALQPACLILLTDGDCLRKLPSEGGGSLQLQFGNLPLRDFYQEPFRWDQRIFCLGVGPNATSLHPSLRAFCDVTGGCHSPIRSVAEISQVTTLMSRLLAPRLPPAWPLQNPLRLPHVQPASKEDDIDVNGEAFVNGGPVCAFQVIERNSSGQMGTVHRAMLLYIPSWHNDAVKPQKNHTPLPPIWCLPESFFPSKKMDTLPPRKAQPLLNYTRYYQAVDSCAFDPVKVMQMLHRLDHFIVSNRSLSHGSQQSVNKLLQRDVYVCHWLMKDGRVTNRNGPSSQKGIEHFPVFVPNAGRNSSSDENVLNIGILHVPEDSKVPGTLTLLPPDPHILIPLLLRAAEVEHRQLKKAAASSDGEPGKMMTTSKNLIMDENWRSEMRAYLFRVPPYYHPSLRRCLRSSLPPSVHSLLNLESAEAAISQCLSRPVMQKIRNGEQIAKTNNDRQEQREGEYRRQASETNHHTDTCRIRYGQFDCRSPISSYLNALRNLPPPPSKRKIAAEEKEDTHDKSPKSMNEQEEKESKKSLSVVECISDLPPECLLAFYETRRRWIFGGTGLTTRGIFVEGVHSGSDSHHYKVKRSFMDESLLSVAGVGASALNCSKISKMGDFKERLLFANQPIIGYGSNDSAMSPVSTAPNGAPIWSLSDDVLPSSLFDPKTGEFDDSPQARVRARLLVNFGNPFRDKRGNTFIPEEFLNQRPPSQRSMSGKRLSSGSPPHDPFSASEGEGEAEFAMSPPRVEENQHVPRKRPDSPIPPPPGREKKMKITHNNISKSISPPSTKKLVQISNTKKPPNPPLTRPPPPPPVSKPPPPKAPKRQQQQPSARPPQKPPGPPSTPKPPQPAPSKQQPPGPQKQLQTIPPAPPAEQSPNVKPNVQLPPGWIAVWSKSQKKYYFFDKKTNRSVWEWPPPGGV